jgi:hypothetical protein
MTGTAAATFAKQSVLSAKLRGAVRDGVVQKQYRCATQ